MQVETTRFGGIEVDQQLVIEMPAGMIGLERCKRFALLEGQGDSAFKWLQSLDDPALAFIVINPMDFFADYEVALTDEQAEALDLSDPADAVLLATVTVCREQEQVSANLAGPIVVNAQTLRARQIVLENERYSTKHVICYPLAPCPAVSGRK